MVMVMKLNIADNAHAVVFAVFLAVTAMPDAAQAQTVTATVSVGSNANSIAVNPVNPITNKVLRDQPLQRRYGIRGHGYGH
jgi:hypothetical protein